ncbi:UDP-N-acetylmuramate dehydrogenase [Fimbriiglobus ruber]|uniref:UDP-N-acetylenolpyruvoylglucosamine reductase n=1 Tax=Fimbriiglobus ruber TaxID=1908690 RepID=A0A225DJ16_9BACT|nr:UDP-N-acetylmuramate dehydrogenase [Fimbriiglobus ruber]OWK39694.1 UDP-N-acetylenolpyruvoylglucosamine reductase [Fimbriiglobus ruber]
MSLAEAFPQITKTREPLAPYTHLRIGGPAEFFVQPRTMDELKGVLRYCTKNSVPLRMLGGGFNLLVRDDPVPGAVMRLGGPAFDWIEASGRTIRAAGGGQLYDLIAHAVKAGLGGLETLVGLRGSVGGSVRCNVGDRSGEIAAAVRRVAVLTDEGTEQIRSRDELNFGDHSSDLDEPVILWVEFELETDAPDAILKRMRRAWVIRKGGEPLSFQSSVRMFRNPSGGSAAALVDRAGLAKTKVGGAEVSDRNGNYAVAHPGTTARDILRLIDLVRTKVKDSTGVSLQQELHVW